MDALNQVNKPRLRNGNDITDFVDYQAMQQLCGAMKYMCNYNTFGQLDDGAMMGGVYCKKIDRKKFVRYNEVTRLPFLAMKWQQL